MSEESDNNVNIDDIVEEISEKGVSERTTPRKLFVRVSRCATYGHRDTGYFDCSYIFNGQSC